MQQTRAQVQLQYHQTLNRICEMELLAEQLTKLAESYRKEETGKRALLREENAVYASGPDRETPGEALRSQARELKAAAEEWFHYAREEYRTSLQAIRMEEERRTAW